MKKYIKVVAQPKVNKKKKLPIPTQLIVKKKCLEPMNTHTYTRMYIESVLTTSLMCLSI